MVVVANKSQNSTNDLTDAVQEATRLAKSLQQHKINVENMDRKGSSKTYDDDVKLTKKKDSNEDHHFSNVELSLLDGMSDLNVDIKSTMSSETIAKIQAQIEGKV